MRPWHHQSGGDAGGVSERDAERLALHDSRARMTRGGVVRQVPGYLEVEHRQHVVVRRAVPLVLKVHCARRLCSQCLPTASAKRREAKAGQAEGCPPCQAALSVPGSWLGGATPQIDSQHWMLYPAQSTMYGRLQTARPGFALSSGSREEPRSSERCRREGERAALTCARRPSDCARSPRPGGRRARRARPPCPGSPPRAPRLARSSRSPADSPLNLARRAERAERAEPGSPPSGASCAAAVRAHR